MSSNFSLQRNINKIGTQFCEKQGEQNPIAEKASSINIRVPPNSKRHTDLKRIEMNIPVILRLLDFLLVLLLLFSNF